MEKIKSVVDETRTHSQTSSNLKSEVLSPFQTLLFSVFETSSQMLIHHATKSTVKWEEVRSSNFSQGGQQALCEAVTAVCEGKHFYSS